MSGKISGVDNSQPPQAGSSGGVGQRPAGVAAEAAAGTGATSEVVQITDTANQLATVAQTLDSSPVVNQARVAGLANAIGAGTYPVQPERIANQLLQFERLLPQDPAE